MSNWELLSDFQKTMCRNAQHRGILIQPTSGGTITIDGVNSYVSPVESAEARDAMRKLEYLGFIECDARNKKGRKSHFILTHDAYKTLDRQTLIERMIKQAELEILQNRLSYTSR